MSKAEKRACQYTGYCKNESYSDFLNGYHQAEEDLELSWEDIEKVCLIAKEVHQFRGFWSESVYQEVLKRFNKGMRNK